MPSNATSLLGCLPLKQKQKTTKLNLRIVYIKALSLGQQKFKISHWSKVWRVISLSSYLTSLRPMFKQMTLNEKTCWNPTLIIMDTIAYTCGYFWKGGPKITIVHGSRKIPTIHLWHIFLKSKVEANLWWFQPLTPLPTKLFPFIT